MTTERSNEPVDFGAFLGDDSASAVSVPEPEHDEAQADEPTTYTGKRVREDATTDDAQPTPPTTQPGRENVSVLPPMTPTMGLAKYRYGYNVLRKKGHIVPALSRKQVELLSSDYELARQMMRDEINAAHAEALVEHNAWQSAQAQADLDEYEQLLIDHIRRYNQSRRWCAVIANVKGGASKSPTSAILANCIGWVTRRLTTAIDNNPYEGTLWKWLDIDRQETVTVRQMNERILDGNVREFIDFSAPLGSNPYNVQLVVSDRVAQKQSYDHDIAKTVIVTTKNNSIFTVNDTSNDIGAGAVEAALEESDVLVVPALNKDDKLEGVRATMDNLSDWGHKAIVKHAVVLVNGLHPGESAEDYRDVLMLDQETILIGIPYDPWLNVFQPILPEKLQQQTRIACLEYTLIVSRVARHVQEQGHASPTMQFKQGELVKLSSGRKPILSYVKKISQHTPQLSATAHGSITEGEAR